MHADAIALSALFAEQAVFRRTPAGQREVLVETLPLAPQARRFLAVINGHTPLHVLLALGFGGQDMQPHVEALLEAGLIEVCPAD
ncbi:hypothetical protein OOT46_09480 [Aquabacterium sp. A7-Y]|uniref:hypothetical protein n=1 Tax=Aquabacterium sp. A7-Y TaxID=1349605 RepID=UPI00223CD861|nr:hypothetical protein [Aquabacterium sp. A7-Y]MCW7538078.1 hypothetical protein [Aquabacterium sp. A7-Y]